MRVLSLSHERQLLRQVEMVFSECISELLIEGTASAFLHAANNDPWDVFLIDFDALPAGYKDPVEFVDQITTRKPLVVIGSFEFANWHDKFRQLGAIVLHKPSSAGEIGLILRRLHNG